MPRKKKPVFDPKGVNPCEVVDVRVMEDQGDGATATLILPRVPEDKALDIGHACALAILGVLKWPDDKAKELADRVRDYLADEMKMISTPSTDIDPELTRARRQRERDEWAKNHPGSDLDELDDLLPF